ncbi:Hypothetical predicted protein, partial [Lynx pardinus]
MESGARILASPRFLRLQEIETPGAILSEPTPSGLHFPEASQEQGRSFTRLPDRRPPGKGNCKLCSSQIGPQRKKEEWLLTKPNK